MRVHRRFQHSPPAARGAAAAIGNFDGVHQGHRAVIRAARAAAARLGAGTAAVTFEPHPREVLRPEQTLGRLTGFRRKALLLAEAGVEHLFVLPFDKKLMALPAERFVADMLVGHLGLRAVAAGDDFRFGHRRMGDVALLAAEGARHGLEVTVVEPLLLDGGICSSTRIRACLTAGAVGEARRLLGYPFEVEGVVRPGDQRGRELGFPTANVHPLRERTIEPAIGIYAVRARPVDAADTDPWWPAVAYIGSRPTFDGKNVLLEVHLLDGGRDLYGRRLRVAFLERIRGDMTFTSAAELQRAIARDIEQARLIHAPSSPSTRD